MREGFGSVRGHGRPAPRRETTRVSTSMRPAPHGTRPLGRARCAPPRTGPGRHPSRRRAVWRRGLPAGDVVREHPLVVDDHDRALGHALQRRVGRIPWQGDAPVGPRRDRVAVQGVPPAVPPLQRDARDTFLQVPSKAASSSSGMPRSPGRSGPWATRTGARALANEGRPPSEPGLVTAPKSGEDGIRAFTRAYLMFLFLQVSCIPSPVKGDRL